MSGYGSQQERKVGWDTAGGRTAAFVAAGLLILAVGGWLQAPQAIRSRQGDGATALKVLFPEFTDPSQAASLAITSFDEETATLRAFKVVKVNGVWVLPSHQNYPADARDQLAAAATELIDRPVLSVKSTSPGDHELFGVIEPDVDKIEMGVTGVGTLVEMADASGKRLARLVIGKEEPRSTSGGNNAERPLRYVRRAGQDPVYLVDLDASKFTTTFENWIEKDLLKLSPWDVTQLTINDSTCSFEIDPASGLMVSQDRKARIQLAYDDKEAAWSLVKLVEYEKGDKSAERTLADNEELASSKLNDLRNALGDLKIVEVARKPAGLSAELEANEKFTGDREAVLSLAQRGFFPFQTGEILSSSGETVVGMKDGVEYLLRFGNKTSVAPEAAVATASEKPSDVDAGGRYLFVMARLNEGLIAKPELQPLPEVPEAAGGEPTKDDEAKDAPEKSGAVEAGKADADTDKADGESKEPAGDGEAADPLAKADEAEAKAQATIEERRRIERENRLAQEAYDEKLAVAKKRVRELNARFADWYYVVSAAEYAKIRLGEADVIQPKASSEEASASPAAQPAP